MRIRFRAYGIGIPTQVNGEYELPDGCTAEEAAAIILGGDYAQQPSALEECILTINRIYAQPEQVLHDGDFLSIMRTLGGG